MQRLQSRAQFQAVLAGRTLAKTAHFALHHLALPVLPLVSVNGSSPDLFPGHSLWLGAMAPKRWAKRAVTRNAIKRQIYTVTAQFDAGAFSGIPQAAYVLRLRAGFDKKQFISATSEQLKQAVRAELLVLMARAGATHAGQDIARPC